MAPRGRTRFPFRVESLASLPPALRRRAEATAPPGQTWTTIAVIPEAPPTPSGPGRLLTEQVIAFSPAGVLYAAEPRSRRSIPPAIWLPIEVINSIRLSLILLYGRLEIWGQDSRGVASKIDLEYHTLGHPLLAKDLRVLIRGIWRTIADPQISREVRQPLTGLEGLSYSFYHGLIQEAVQPGEQVLGYIFQPEIRVPWLRWLTRAIAPQTLLTLTDRQVILLQEDLRFKTHHEWIFTFFPLATVQPKDMGAQHEWRLLRLAAGVGASMPSTDLILWPENAACWHNLWASIQASARARV